MGRVVPIANGKVDKNEVSFDADGSWNDQKIHGKFKGKLSHDFKRGGDQINGSIEIVIEDGSLPLAWVARRGIDADGIVGTWKLKFVTPDGNTVEPQLKLTADAGSLKGTYTSTRFGEHEAKEIKLDGSSLSWTVEFERNGTTVKGVYKGQLEPGADAGSDQRHTRSGSEWKNHVARLHRRAQRSQDRRRAERRSEAGGTKTANRPEAQGAISRRQIHQPPFRT